MENTIKYTEDILTLAKERSAKFQILKLKKLLKLILKNEFKFDEENLKVLKILNDIKSNFLLTYGSDFFWSQVHILDSLIENPNSQNIENRFSYFLINVFDSYYHLLPNDIKIFIQIDEECEIILPELKLYFKHYSNEYFYFRKIDSNSISLEYNNSIYHSLTITSKSVNRFFKLKCERINESTFMLFQKGESIYEKHYINECCENSVLSYNLKLKFVEAFDIIKRNDIDLYNKLVRDLKFIVPYGNYSSRKYPNFAIATLKKTIFMSIELLNDPLYLVAECIIHEFSHCELHIVQDTIQLTQIENGILNKYSPWRKDPRHLLGIIHGIYISHRLINFYSKYLSNKENKHFVDVTNKITIIIHQMIVAFKQVHDSELTEFSIRFFGNIMNSTYQTATFLKIPLNNRPKEVVNHIDAWKIRNEGYLLVE